MDYPRNLREFDRLFAHKDACLRFLEQVRWGNHFVCQSCGSTKYWVLGTGLRRCQRCRFKNSVKTGTIFESSRLPLKMWFYAVWWITAQKSGVSALDLQRDVGLGSYRSAWLLLHKIRNAMTHADKTLLEGDVELQEALVGPRGDIPVLVAAEFTGLKRIGRARLAQVGALSPATVETFLTANVLKGSTLHTDGKRSYGDLTRLGFRHAPAKPLKGKPSQPLPHVHFVAEQLQRWLRGTLHGRVEAKHFDSYLEEFVFRFGHRDAKARGVLFQRVMENAVRIEPSPYKKVVSRKG
ncbi:MAG: IS1595 family transposase [Bdellovibrionota bacterium]